MKNEHRMTKDQKISFLEAQLVAKKELLSYYGNKAFDAYEIGDIEQSEVYNDIVCNILLKEQELQRKLDLIMVEF